MGKRSKYKDVGIQPAPSGVGLRMLEPQEIADLTNFFELFDQIGSFLLSNGYDAEGHALYRVQQELKERVFIASYAQFGAPRAVH